VSLLYADTSALARAYLADEPDHAALRDQLLEGDDPVVTSELAAVELSAAMTAAERAGRIRDASTVMHRIDADLSGEAVAMIALHPEDVLREARRLIASHPLFAVDAIHLAVALVEARRFSPDGVVTLVTRDPRQADAARSEGMPVSD
jgi:predicted nucleic acid-binding protein